MDLYVFLSGRVHYLETSQQTGFSCYYSQSPSIYTMDGEANERLPLYVVAPNSAVNNVLTRQRTRCLQPWLSFVFVIQMNK